MAVADQDLGAADAHEEIVRIEECAEERAAKIEGYQKFILAVRIAVVGGTVVLFAMLIGAIQSDLWFAAGSVASLFGGSVVWGQTAALQ
jgi:hypothetical protein